MLIYSNYIQRTLSKISEALGVWKKGINCETLEEQASADDKRLLSSLQSWAEGEAPKKRTAAVKCAQESCQTAAHPWWPAGSWAKLDYGTRNGLWTTKKESSNTSEVTKLEFTFKRLRLKNSSLSLFNNLSCYFSFSIPKVKMAFPSRGTPMSLPKGKLTKLHLYVCVQM